MHIGAIEAGGTIGSERGEIENAVRFLTENPVSVS